MEQILLDSPLRHVKNDRVTGGSHHGFTQGQLTTEKFGGFLDGVTTQKYKANYVIYLALWEMFDTVPLQHPELKIRKT